MFNRPWLTEAGVAQATSPSTLMAVAIARLGKPFYEGTVPADTTATRRRRNKAARIARRGGRR